MIEDAAPHRLPATVRVAVWCARHSWLVLAVWLVATIGTFVASQTLGGIATQGATNSSGFSRTEAAQGDDLWSAANVQREPGEDFIVVLTGEANAVADPEFRAAVADVVASLQAATFEGQPLFGADSVIDPFNVPAEFALLSPDGTSARIPARIVYHAGDARPNRRAEGRRRRSPPAPPDDRDARRQ